MSLANYSKAFSELHLVGSNNVQPDSQEGLRTQMDSVHRACVLLATIDLIAAGGLAENRILLDNPLWEAFSVHYRKHRPTASLDNPTFGFMLLGSSEFWHLEKSEGFDREFPTTPTINTNENILARAQFVQHASFDEELFQILQDESNRTHLRTVLESNIETRASAFLEWCREQGIPRATRYQNVNSLHRFMRQPLSHKKEDEDSILLDLLAADEPDLTQIRNINSELFMDFTPYRDEELRKSALQTYLLYLRTGAPEAVLARDIQEIKDRDLHPTVREALIEARRGQGGFRTQVLSHWEGRCAVTGFQNSRFLVASHIKPWSLANDQERLDPFNGFALTANLDRAFDQGFITFDSDGAIAISSTLPEHDEIGIHCDLSVSLDQKHQPYLDFHREHVFLG